MAITDNLLVRMQAAAGQAAPLNEAALGDGEILTSGTGTATLVDVGAEKAWNLTGGQFAATLTTGYTLTGSTDGGGATIAVRFRINTLPTGSFDYFWGLSPTTTVSAGLCMGRQTASYRARLTTSISLTCGSVPTSTVFTLVLRATAVAASSSDVLEVWRDTVGRVGTDPDFAMSPGSANFSSYALSKWIVESTNSADYDILDYLFWGRELTDAEAAAVADGIRTQLPLSGGGATGQPFPPSLHSGLVKTVVRFH